MKTIELIANLSSVAVFIWLIYKAACTGAATPARCRLLERLLAELKDHATRLGAELHRLTERLQDGNLRHLAAEVSGLFDGRDAPTDLTLPPEYQPVAVLRRIVMAQLGGATELAWDEHRHWLRRISFGWSALLAGGRQAKEFGLLYTVVGAFLAFACLSDKAKPFEVFGALSLAMLTTIVGLLISLAIDHWLVQRFYGKWQAVQIESEQVVLELLRNLGELRSRCRRARQTARTHAGPDHTGQAVRRPTLHASADASCDGGVRCAAN